MKVVIAGCGFLGEAAADLFYDKSCSVLGVCASEESVRRLAGKPYPVIARDISSRFTAPQSWEETDALVHCASSAGGGPEAYRAIYLEGLKTCLEAFRPRRVVFTGSTSVYAQTGGEWVDEESETRPGRETGRVLLEAEALALAHHGFAIRLSGLYGPGRSVLLRRFLCGEATIEGDGNRWINQIHRDDAAQAIIHLLLTGAAPGLYNVSDDTPARQRDVYGWLAEALNRPLPPSGPPGEGRKRGWTSKRVSNAKLRAAGWTPRYSSFREAISLLAGTI